MVSHINTHYLYRLISKHLGLLLSLCLVLGVSPGYAASITASASVDRQTITIDDSLTLSVRINDTGTYKTPNLSALEKDFQIAGTSQSSRHSMINGRSNSVTEWTISLYPKRDGLLIIPAIKINDAKTNPIAIQVNKPSALPPGQLDTVFVETSISHTKAYVQQQILLSLTVYHSVQLDNLNMSELALENATIKKVGQNSFYRTVQGVRHRVHEINYAIFPNKAGKLVIPEQIFSGKEISQSRYYGGGSLIRRKSEPQTITINEIPKAFTGDLWLAAQQLQLQETWSKPPEQLHVGDSITRSITTTANGVTAAQLPPVQFNALKGAKLYPDQAETNNAESATGIAATRIDSTALIATREGTITLPAIEVTWWDTQSNSLQIASLAERKINVLPAIDDAQKVNGAVDHSQPQTTAGTEKVITVVNPFWMIACLIMLALWLVTSVAYWRLHKQVKQAQSPQLDTTSEPTQSEKMAYKHLQQICRKNDTQQLRPALIQWAQQRWPERAIHTLDDIGQASQHAALINLLMQFDNNLYGKITDSSEWNGESLLALINEARKQKIDQQQQHNALPDLYK